MDQKYHRALEDEMDQFMSEMIEDCKDIQEFYLHPELGHQMAEAAMAVFEAGMRAQEYAKTKD